MILGLSTLVLVLSGFYIVFSESWSVLYRGNLIFHPLLGFFVTGVMLLHTWRVWKKQRQGDPGQDVSPARKAVDLLLLLLWILCFASGLPLLLGWGIQYVSLCYLHRYISYVLVAFLALHPVQVWWDAKRAGPDQAPRDSFGVKRSAGAVLLVLFLALGVALADRAGREDAYTYELTTETKLSKEAYLSKERIMRPELVEQVSISESCGAAAFCHADLIEDFAKSAHNVGFQMPFFQKNLDLLVEETGEHNVRNCAGCHTPLAVVAGNNDYTQFKEANNSSCVFCHSVESVAFGPGPRKSSYTVRPNARHLAMFPLEGEDRGLDGWDHYLIKLNPLGHARVFSNPIYKEDRYCQACHHLQLKTPLETGFQRPTCVDCHMQPRDLLGLEGTEMNHYFPGSNTAIPFLRGDEETLTMMRKWLRGDFLLNLEGWGAFWDLRSAGQPDEERSHWLRMRLEPMAKPVPGDPFSFRIITANVGMEHPFPSSVVELIQVWLDLEVRDSRGNVIYRSGALNPDGTLDPQAHTLGGYIVDDQGNVILRNRIWVIAKKIIEREIKAGKHTQDEYTFTLPEDTGDFIEIEASWKYRKLNQPFVDWAFPGEQITMPAADVATMTRKIQVEKATDS